MQSRREFLRNAAAVSGATFFWGSATEAVARAMEIDPDEGTTFLDAEHIVILMQENRSFDHAYGSLRGVRGFRDPRVHVQPDGRKVWFQTDAKGRTFAPFRLDISGSNSTWIGGLPHSWRDQVDARNGGKYDKWLIAKARNDVPLALGHYSREDLGFYYALADAFTVCDQAFCSSLTGTTPNRLYLWTGTIRETPEHTARVQNGDTDYEAEAAWKTYPERLEDAGVSWRIYQNEISIDSGFVGEEDSWLSNFTDNPIEWFTQYRVRFAKGRRQHVARLAESLPNQIAEKRKALSTLTGDPLKKAEDEIAKLEAYLKAVETERATYTDKAWSGLPPKARALHERAFTTNEAHPHYRALEPHRYRDGEVEREVKVPKGDTLHQFRKDVDTGNLPAVSWIVAPEHFSDHPGSAWYGAWYLSEVMNILTKNPDVWKKTIFILCYDENDGYFDHVPPFAAPHPGRPETGKTSEGIDTKADVSNAHGRDSSIGLGYRCPLVVASPWSRGGYVNSQVFDHTSILMLLEKWTEGKGKPARETNISAWRRAVCGDMTSVFRPYKGENHTKPKSLERDKFVEHIHQAQFREKVKPVEPLTDPAIASFDVRRLQEPGTRPSNALPYELETNAELRDGRLVFTMQAGNRRFGRRSAGSPFNAYSYGPEMLCRSYAARPGSTVEDSFEVGSAYHVRVDGPNGFMREFRATGDSPKVKVMVTTDGNYVSVKVTNQSTTRVDATLRDESYGAQPQKQTLSPAATGSFKVSTSKSHGWYDFTVSVGALSYRYSGRIETGKDTLTDPAMG